jgi:signal peptidase I
MTFQETWKKIWNFLWHSNSIWSIIVDILLIFLILKFILLPGFGLIVGSPVPLVIIESGSMEHQGNFDSWWNLHGQWYLDNNISKETVNSWKFHNGMNKGDIILVTGNKNKDYKAGDVIVFSVSENNVPIIHRIIAIHEINGQIFYETKGDHNDGQHPYEKLIAKNQVLGQSSLRIPYVGWIKLFFVGIFNGKF